MQKEQRSRRKAPCSTGGRIVRHYRLRCQGDKFDIRTAEAEGISEEEHPVCLSAAE